MQAHDVTLDQVMESDTRAHSTSAFFYFSNGAMIGTGGFIETPNQRVGSARCIAARDGEDLAKLPHSATRRRPTARRWSSERRRRRRHRHLAVCSAMRSINDGPGLMIVVDKYPWPTRCEATQDVEAALDELRPGTPRTWRSIRRSSGRQTSSRWRSTT
jgi:uncharacterized protein (DUF2249 family)